MQTNQHPGIFADSEEDAKQGKVDDFTENSEFRSEFKL